ncbi:helix-turn-helix domain-containing protein [Nocardia sp. NPDC051832]|uniref:helix-turn-helix domain-containing protein n=1 Tax=Nocardia sp. NPDC051832 TaxID=3155673 RepID=UPI003440305C
MLVAMAFISVATTTARQVLDSQDIGLDCAERARLAPQVAAVVAQLRGRTFPDLDLVADAMRLHKRTLQRLLNREGTSLSAIVDEARQLEAHRYLTGTALSLNQISELLGLSSQSAFTRCGHRWWGRPPSAIRATAFRARVAAPQ